MKKALKILGIIVGILIAIVLGPWLIVAALWIAGDISQDIALRRYVLPKVNVRGFGDSPKATWPLKGRHLSVLRPPGS